MYRRKSYNSDNFKSLIPLQNLTRVRDPIGKAARTCSALGQRSTHLVSGYSTVLPAYLIHDLICTPIEVAKVLKSLNVNKACGPDGVSPRLLNECHMELAPILAFSWHTTY